MPGSDEEKLVLCSEQSLQKKECALLIERPVLKEAIEIVKAQT
jgi:hypothetical protein